MKDIMSDPALAEAVRVASNQREIRLIIGEFLLKHFKDPYDAPKEFQGAMIEKIASEYSTEAEITEQLEKAGFGFVYVSVMESSGDKVDNEIIMMCKAMGGTITKNGMPCAIMHDDPYEDMKKDLDASIDELNRKSSLQTMFEITKP